MRSSKLILAACVAALLVGTTFAVAGAFVSGTSGPVIFLRSPPPSVVQDALENTSSAFAFDEQQGAMLAAPLTLDITNPGTYSSYAVGTTSLARGTWVDSHLVHSDATAHPISVRRSGTLTFPDDILGVIATPKSLADSDVLGAPGTAYPGKTANRGLDLTADVLTLAADRRSVSFDIQTQTAMDEFRIITVHTNRLATSISDNVDPAQAGNNVTYTVTVKNNEPYTVPGVQVADNFPGTTFVSATASGGCSMVGTTSTCTLGTLAAGASASATIVVKTPSTVPVGGTTLTNTAKSPPGKDPQASESTSVVSPVLDTSISDAPDPVTAGNNVQYVLTVTNNGIAAVASAHVTDTLPPGTTLVASSQPGGGDCSGTGPVDCTLGALGVGESADAQIVATAPATVPAGGTITDTAVASPGNNASANEVTTVEEPTPGVSKGFVLPGDSIAIESDNPAKLTLPETGDGAAVIITQGSGTFCDGPCAGPTTTISQFDGYDDPNNPIHVTLTFTYDGITAAAEAFGATVWKNTDPAHPEVGSTVPYCDTLHAGVAIPHPCVDSRSISEPILGVLYVVSFEIVYLSGDPSFGRK